MGTIKFSEKIIDNLKRICYETNIFIIRTKNKTEIIQMPDQGLPPAMRGRPGV